MLPLFAYSVDLNDLLLLAQQVDRTERRMLQLQKPIIYFGIALGHPQSLCPICFCSVNRSPPFWRYNVAKLCLN